MDTITIKTIAEKISWLIIPIPLPIVIITSSIPALGMTPIPKARLSQKLKPMAFDPINPPISFPERAKRITIGTKVPAFIRE